MTLLTLAEPSVEKNRLLSSLASLRAWAFLVFLLVVFEAWAHIGYNTTFLFNPFNLQSIAVFAIAPLMLALGQTIVIISGGIDLSVGFTMGFAASVFAQCLNMAGPGLGGIGSFAVATLVTIVASLLPGLVNGLLIAKLRIPPFIGTLGMYGVARGVAYLLAKGTTVPISNPVASVTGNGNIFGFPIVVLITAAITVVLQWSLTETRFGQHTYAIGGNRQAAARAGINVPRNTVALYALSALGAGIGGILYTTRFSAGAPQAGEPLLLDSIAAVVIGGASLFGGSGTTMGTVIGALIIAVIQFGLVFVDVEPFWQFIAVGVIIVISVLVDQSQKRLIGEQLVE
jgi:predicted ABC-type sugar transport system permease subunit